MQYERLNDDQQKQLLEQRLQQYEAEHFQHATNKELLVASGATDEQTQAAINDADKAMATLDDVHACCKKMLTEMG